MKKAKYGEFLKLNMGKNTILSFFPHIKEAWLLNLLLQLLYFFGERKRREAVADIFASASCVEPFFPFFISFLFLFCSFFFYFFATCALFVYFGVD